jgi:hypothetical protein
MKVLHLPTEVGGNAWGLAIGENALGLESKVLVSTQAIFNYPNDYCLHLDKKKIKLFHLIKSFLQIRNKYDVFHFNFGSSLIHAPHRSIIHLELPFYPKKARLFATYNGCDARQKYPTMKRCSIAACHDNNCYKGICNSGEQDHFRRQGIEKMSTYVQHIFAVNPDLLHFLPPEKSSFLPYSTWYTPSQKFPILNNKRMTILHIPTNPEAKGTKYIVAAIEKLNKKYSNLFEFINVEKLMSSSEVKKIFEQADLVIDQLLIGWYGATAVECMKLGKPVIVRVNEADLRFVPKEMEKDLREAIINADPFSIESVLEKCILDRNYLQSKAMAGQEYANKWHDPKYVASLTKAKYEQSFENLSKIN